MKEAEPTSPERAQQKYIIMMQQKNMNYSAGTIGTGLWETNVISMIPDLLIHVHDAVFDVIRLMRMHYR